jgi:CRISPR-associated protein (TIGR02710 family)
MEQTSGGSPSFLLVTTVGGSPAAIAAGILHVKPERVLFVCSPETRASVEQPSGRGDPAILDLVRQDGFEVPPGSYDIIEIPDAQDLEGLVQKARREIEPLIREWVKHSGQHRVVVDFTGGTKCMSAGIVLASLDWPCHWQYVGGTERTKGGIGIVVNGKEQIVNPRNPWDTLAWRHVLRAAALFDEGQTGGAVSVLEGALRQTEPGRLKRALSALLQFCRIYHEWDAFRHEDALKAAGDFRGSVDTLSFFISTGRVDEFDRRVSSDVRVLEALRSGADGNELLLADIFSNGLRRLHERRFDDAVARFYRCVEGLAQLALASHGIGSTAEVPVQAIPEPLRSEWRVEEGQETLALPLYRSFQLLHALGDDLGCRFFKSHLADSRKSPLQARNHSILAHGFHAVSEADAKSLLEDVRRLAGGRLDGRIPQFPRLSELLVTL